MGAVEEAGGGFVTGQPDPEGSFFGNLLSPAKRRRAVVWVRDRWGPGRVSERRACRVLGQARSTQRRVRQAPDEEAKLVVRMVELASEYAETRMGFRMDTARQEPSISLAFGLQAFSAFQSLIFAQGRSEQGALLVTRPVRPSKQMRSCPFSKPGRRIGTSSIAGCFSPGMSSRNMTPPLEDFSLKSIDLQEDLE